MQNFDSPSFDSTKVELVDKKKKKKVVFFLFHKKQVISFFLISHLKKIVSKMLFLGF